MNTFPLIRKMPKIELHAHLNGSLCANSIKELGELCYGANSKEFLTLSEEFINFDNVDLDGCFKKFRFMHELTSTKKGLQLATELAIRDFAKDNVIYLELRTTPKTNIEMSKLEYIECVLCAIDRSKKTENIHVCLLPSIDRGQSVAEADDTVNIALQLRNTHKDIITGIDFSGNPKLGEFEKFMPVLEKARQNKLKLALHCAEIDNPLEIEKMIQFGMDRCGHGTFLSQLQLNELGRKNIAVECCLTSNVKCTTVKNYDDHHFKHIFRSKKTSVVLCTDDCGVFDTTLSSEFELAKRNFNLNNDDLMQLTLNAAEHAFVKDSIRHELQQKVKQYFNTRIF
ncbi:adenosine deaminase-like protein [Anastrepha obliqua]|uniref:adenosine deaminase-like protein n=1 Tax=Anastrepha obliqua TaxID=95512 RepID=UPI00240A22E6|nr:adenosine deaminase-like protein [Anastrepha obliqua]XP_054746131.1 adenosine deaminase-like protein [Anastrepha obliqua]XP_054746133.1 adenosine deaminase-like protein [Anastrepha obliqua]XP_054746137.1 adenosine deaminase-like protein [Anastrepha obliqua]XP_054746144.1 adenosine deaminase-like protein [Anastrepha obliqua]XP_054746149.1 adenosine deaminase-like protein [Anastrepha obliqua]